jgi:hypothetical protein
MRLVADRKNDSDVQNMSKKTNLSLFPLSTVVRHGLKDVDHDIDRESLVHSRSEKVPRD